MPFACQPCEHPAVSRAQYKEHGFTPATFVMEIVDVEGDIEETMYHCNAHALEATSRMSHVAVTGDHGQYLRQRRLRDEDEASGAAEQILEVPKPKLVVP